MPEKIGQRLKMVRKLYGLSQRELAKRARVANSAISVMEQDSVSPSVASLGKVLTGFPLAISDFFSMDLNITEPLTPSIAGVAQAERTLSLIAYSAELSQQPQTLLFKQRALILVVSGSLKLSSLHSNLLLLAGQQLSLPPMTLCLASPVDLSSGWVVGRLSS